MRSQKAEVSPFEVLAREVRLTFHQLKALVEALHEDAGGVTAAHRGVLESLFRGGPQTVPAMARARPVSRQHIQVLANRLIALGLVTPLANPAHQRSPLLELTRAGRKKFDDMQKRERRVLAKANLGVADGRLKEAAETLRTLRASIARMTRTRDEANR